MPNRIIREALLDSERYISLANDTERLFFHELLLLVDDYALGNANFGYLRRRTCACMNKTADQVCSILDALVAVDLIRVYESDGNRLLFIPRFGNHPRSAKSKYPLPPDNLGGKEIKDLQKKRIADDTRRRTTAKHLHTNALETEFETEFETETEFGVRAFAAQTQKPIVEKPDKPIDAKTKSPGAEAVLAMRVVGIHDGNPQHPTLLALLDHGAQVDDFVYAARDAVGRSPPKGFAYALGIAERRQRERLAVAPRVPKPEDCLTFRPATAERGARWTRQIRVKGEFWLENQDGERWIDPEHPGNVIPDGKSSVLSA